MCLQTVGAENKAKDFLFGVYKKEDILIHFFTKMIFLIKEYQ